MIFPCSLCKLEAELEILLRWRLSLALMAGVFSHKGAVGVTDKGQIPATTCCVTSGKLLGLPVLLFVHL